MPGIALKPTEASDGRWDVPGVDSPIAGDGGGTSPVPNHDDALKGTRQDLRHRFLSSVAPSGREPSNQATPPPPPLSANLPAQHDLRRPRLGPKSRPWRLLC